MDDSLSLSMRLGGLVASQGIRAWMSTHEYRAIYYDRSVDARYKSEQPRIYVFWHEYILIPLYLRGHCNLAMLLSRHRDADILARVAYHMGFDCVRGSSNRGSAAALLEMSRRGQHMNLAITPDGPRGPRRTMAVGAIYLASKLGMPLVPLGFGVDRPWRVKSWDRHAVPRPFSQIRGVVGPEVKIPAGLDRRQLDGHRQRVERLLNDLTLEAEDWAASGLRREGEVCERRSPQTLLPNDLDSSTSEKPSLVCYPQQLSTAEKTEAKRFSA